MDRLSVAGPCPVVIEDSQSWHAPNQLTLMFYRIGRFTAQMGRAV
jgi:hypothetical protein